MLQSSESGQESCKWQLKVNLSQCKSLCITNKALNHLIPTSSIIPHWKGLTRSQLGIKINQKLSWSAHVNATVLKASQVLNLLRRSLYSSEEAKKRAYTALVRPHIECCAPVWNPHLKKDIISLENVQKRAARWICCKWNPDSFSWSRSYDEACNEILSADRDHRSWAQTRADECSCKFTKLFTA